jgi:peroxiredoxin Q/BCP
VTQLLAKGSPLPDTVLDGPDGPVTLDQIRAGRTLVVAFYSEDATPTCTAQLCAFRDDFAVFAELDAAFVGVSADSPESHAAFAAQHAFPLLADPELAAARAFGVVEEGTKRSLRAIFVSDADDSIVEAIPFYNPANGSQYQAVFVALGMEL